MKKSGYLFFALLMHFGCKNIDPGAQVIHEAVPIENLSEREWVEGWLSVDENRVELNSNFIKIPYILSKAPDSLKIGNTPLLIMSGGPGNSSLNMANGVVNSTWGKTRDIIVLEQRGTSLAMPSLACPEIDSLRIIGMKLGLHGEFLDSLKMLSIQMCYDKYNTRGVDFSGYNTLESVEDIEDLRKALKVDQMILYGMSYSCNLMKAYARTYPHNVEAMVLDSPLPHNVNYDEEAYENIDNAFSEVISYYSGSKKQFTDWKEYIDLVKDSIFKISIDSIDYHYTKNELIDIPLFNMSGHNTLSAVNESIKKIISGDHSDIPDIIQYYLEPSGQAVGMRYSLWIGEELPDEKQDRITENENSYPWLSGYAINDVSFKTQKYWPTKSIYDKKVWPNHIYNGPVLILSGQFDPWTPVSYGVKMKMFLPNAEHIVYSEKTHLPGFTKQGMSNITQFLNSILE